MIPCRVTVVANITEEKHTVWYGVSEGRGKKGGMVNMGNSVTGNSKPPSQNHSCFPQQWFVCLISGLGGRR